MNFLLWFFLLAPPEPFTYWIQPCTAELRSSCEPGDADLARWALDAWQKAAPAGIAFTPVAEESRARIRFYWVSEGMPLYGEARPIRVEGRTGAAIQVQTDMRQLGPAIAAAARQDRLFRESVVYLTCLHESGHALGLPHTASFEDIMYSFQYGGDLVAYFSRYRGQLDSRARIRERSGISAADRRKLLEIYSAPR
jgi:predicted Zn-dependent protease